MKKGDTVELIEDTTFYKKVIGLWLFVKAIARMEIQRIWKLNLKAKSIMVETLM